MTIQPLPRLEMKGVTFTVPGVLGGKQRAGRKHLGDGRVISFNPKQSRVQESMVAQYASMAKREQRCPILTGPIALVITIVRHTPTSWPKHRRAQAAWITGKPDADNIVKLIADGLNHSSVWLDDSQVAVLSLMRRYQDDLPESVTVSVRELQPGDMP